MKRQYLAKFSLFIAVIFLTTACHSTPKSSDDQENAPVIADDVTYGASDYKKISDANNRLAFDTLNSVSPNEANNRFISPVSLFMALSMLYNGADGVTKEEIGTILSADRLNDEALNKANASLLASIQKSSDDIVLNIANAIWLADNHEIQSDFKKTNHDYFNAEIATMDLNDSQSIQKINEWVKQATNGTIEHIVEPPLDPTLVSLIINAIYFKGEWMYAFDPDQTEADIFHLNGDKKKDLPFMKLEEELSYLETDTFEAISLPYGEEKMNMDILLPKKNASLSEIREQLTPDKWDSLQEAFTKQEGILKLPKFNLSYETSLVQTLKQMGIKTAFDPDQANLANIVQHNDSLMINDVIQKTHIDIDEEGTEASGTTAVEIEETSASANDPFEMKVNRPFLLTIRDNETDVILFIGAINNPKVDK